MAEVRGSTEILTRLFDGNPGDAELQAALQAARENYRVLRWWKYGQPAVDAIRAKIEIQPDRVGTVLHDLVNLQGGGLQVSLEGFPYGLPALEGLVVDVLLERQVG